MTAGMFRKVSDIDIIEGEDFAQVTFSYIHPSPAGVETKVSYKVLGDGSVHVRASYAGTANLPNIPAFGMEFKLKKRYSQVRYYGNGPAENHVDRMEGARLGIYTTTAEENLTPYLVPQECGNRTGLRWLEVSDGIGRGLRFTAEKEPFEGSVLPVSAYELECAAHQEELPPHTHTWVRILAKQMGVGGDDSWGAPVHDEYKISSEENIEVEFIICPAR